MKESNLMFIPTFSGDRTNIMAGFRLLDKQQFMEEFKSGKLGGRIRYGKIGGWTGLLKEMLLDEFEENFDSSEFTKEEITDLFRKDISMKYGIHGEKAKIKPLGKKDLEVGCVYTDFTGQNYLYLGEVRKETDWTYLKRYQSDKKPVEIEEGYGFIWWYGGSKGLDAQSVQVLKGIKRFEKKSDISKVEMVEKLDYESGEQRWGRERKITVHIKQWKH